MALTYYKMKMLQDIDHRIKKQRIRPDDTTRKCRVCLKQGLIPIFTKYSPNYEIPKYLKLICDIDVTAYDKNPQMLCKSCYDDLTTAAKLRKTAKKTQLKLNKISQQLVKVKNETITKSKIIIEVSPTPLKQEQTDRMSEHEAETVNEMNLKQETDHDDDDDDEPSESTSPPPETIKEIKMKKKVVPYEKYYKKIDTDNKPAFQCQFCQKIYKKSSLADHLIMHLPETASQYICEVCGKTFKKSSTFCQHRDVHSNELPYLCNSCPYRGRKQHLLLAHIKRMHSKEYNYQCTQCPKKFNDSSNLRKHIVRHGDPTFQCNTCQKLFYEKSSLKEHIECCHMTQTALHKCDICGNFYKRKKKLLEHQTKAHKRKKVYNARAAYHKMKKTEDVT